MHTGDRYISRGMHSDIKLTRKSFAHTGKRMYHALLIASHSIVSTIRFNTEHG
jgi:hypothetical protein